MNVIVVAALVLIVLIVVTIIFTGKFGTFSRGINSCQDKGGVQYSGTNANSNCISEGGTPIGPYYNDKNERVPDAVCCVKSVN